MQDQTAGHHSRIKTLWDKTWKDSRGHIVIWQMPNAWLLAWAALTFVSLLVNGTLADIFSWLAVICLAVWSVQEIAAGVNYFRRGLGIVLMGFSIASIINLL